MARNGTDVAISGQEAPPAAATHARRGRLFRKYLLLILSLVTIALLASGGTSVYFSYQENKAALASLQHEKALAAASRIEQYVHQIEQQLTYAALPQLDAADVELRRIEFLKLLRQVPDVTDIAQIDPSGSRADRGVAARHGQDRIGQGPVAGARVPECEAWSTVVRTGLLPQGDGTVHDHCPALRGRKGAGHGCRRESQVHLGCRLADQDRREGEGIRRRQQRLPGRGSRHRPRAAQDRSFPPCAREDCRRRRSAASLRSCRRTSRARRCWCPGPGSNPSDGGCSRSSRWPRSTSG